jgi:hypothetical protein
LFTVVVCDPLFIAVPVPLAEDVLSSGLDVSTPPYSDAYISNNDVGTPLSVMVMVIAPAPPVILLA